MSKRFTVLMTLVNAIIVWLSCDDDKVEWGHIIIVVTLKAPNNETYKIPGN